MRVTAALLCAILGAIEDGCFQSGSLDVEERDVLVLRVHGSDPLKGDYTIRLSAHFPPSTSMYGSLLTMDAGRTQHYLTRALVDEYHRIPVLARPPL